jgi:hypothetical protein
MSKRSIGIALFVFALLIVACADKAQPDYEVCTSLADKGKLSAARDACKAAAQLDSQSKAGQAALKKLDDLQLALHAQDVAMARQAQAAAEASAFADTTAEAACTTHKWGTICDVGHNGSGLQVSHSLAECNSMISDLKLQTGISCDPCHCLLHF